MATPTRPARRMTGAVSHVDLLAVARRVRCAAERDDIEALHAELTRLRTAVMDHVRAERERLDELPGSAGTVVADGHERLLRLLSEVLFTPAAADADDGGCNCIVRSAEIELSIRRQAQLEDALLRRHPRPGSTGT